MKIEAGKYYKTRDGRKVGPIVNKKAGTFNYYDTEPRSGHGWYSNGKLYEKGDDNKSDLISEWLRWETIDYKSPIRTVTRREIVDGNYGNLTIYFVQDDLRIDFIKSKHTAEELREAAHLLNQIAEVLEDNGK